MAPSPPWLPHLSGRSASLLGLRPSRGSAGAECSPEDRTSGYSPPSLWRSICCQAGARAPATSSCCAPPTECRWSCSTPRAAGGCARCHWDEQVHFSAPSLSMLIAAADFVVIQYRICADLTPELRRVLRCGDLVRGGAVCSGVPQRARQVEARQVGAHAVRSVCCTVIHTCSAVRSYARGYA